jgi:hypothetical protein
VQSQLRLFMRFSRNAGIAAAAGLRRQWAARRQWALDLPAAPPGLVRKLERLWPGWPATWQRLIGLAAGAFVLGGVLALPFALAGRQLEVRGRPAVAVERAAPVVTAAVTAEGPAVAPVAPSPRSRAQLARDMAREAFENERWQDGVWYFRESVRAQRRAPDDDVLILYTIAALSDEQAAPKAERLLRDLGRDAQPLVAETARSHPDRVIRARARKLVRASAEPRPFLRWLH